MDINIEHPAITRVLRTGEVDFVRVCPRCEEPITEKVYELYGEFVCEPCFIEWVEEEKMWETDTEYFADLLGVKHERI